jgi:Domain of unknown function (DUF4287)
MPSTTNRPHTRAALTSDDAVRGATGRHYDDWFAVLDEEGADGRTHGEIAASLMEEHAVEHWWAQTITVEYEVARGMRPRGGGRDGLFAVSASRTIAAPVERLFEAFADSALRQRWLPGAVLRERTSQPGRAARFDWKDGATRVNVGFTAGGEAKSRVELAHERLPDAEAAAETKAYWRERLAALKDLMEG